MNKKIGKYIVVVCSIGVLLSAGVIVFAQDDNTTDGTQNPNLIQNLKVKKAETIKQVQDRIQQGTEKIKQLREQAQVKVQQTKEKVQQKLTKIKDQKKQQLAKKIANQFDHLNQVWTDHFVKVLDHLDLVLQKVQTRTDKASANGKDITAVNTAIETAKTAIATARTAVTAQAQKTYTISDTTIDAGVSSTTATTTAGQEKIMQNLRLQFKTAKDQLQKDLFALRDGVIKDARNAVKNALQELTKINGVDQKVKNDQDSTTNNNSN